MHCYSRYGIVPGGTVVDSIDLDTIASFAPSLAIHSGLESKQ